MVQALLPGCSTMHDATNQRDARRSKEPPPVSDPSRQYVAPAPLSSPMSSRVLSEHGCIAPVTHVVPHQRLGTH